MAKRYLVVGLGMSGCAAADELLSRGAEVWGVDDSKEESDLQALVSKGLRLEPAPEVDEIIVSPGIPPSHPALVGAPVIGEAELALRHLPNPCVGVTGTNGKTTVALLTAHLLNSVGVKARAVGNIGVPLSGLHADPDEVLVVELSSYQLDTMQSKVLNAAVLLNITPDHLDRYGTMGRYAHSKARIADLVRQGGSVWVDAETRAQFPSLFGPEWDLLVEYILPVSYRFRSKRDLLNITAALALCQSLGVEVEACFPALDSFTKPEHRIEWVATIDGVQYFNDSKGTNVDAVIHAVESMPGQSILIAGGVDKGGSYAPWVEAFRGHVRAICVIGEAARRIASEMSADYAVTVCRSLSEAIERSQEMAQEGDSILLSPGCSSFDMFRNYAHRGDEFKRLVGELEGARKE